MFTMMFSSCLQNSFLSFYLASIEQHLIRQVEAGQGTLSLIFEVHSSYC